MSMPPSLMRIASTSPVSLPPRGHTQFPLGGTTINNCFERWPAPIESVRVYRQPVPDHALHRFRTACRPFADEGGKLDRVGRNFTKLRVGWPVGTRSLSGQPKELSAGIERHHVAISWECHAKWNANPTGPLHCALRGTRIAQGERCLNILRACHRVHLENIVRRDGSKPPERSRVQPARQCRNCHRQRSDTVLNRLDPEAIAVQPRFRAIKINLKLGQLDVFRLGFGNNRGGGVADEIGD